jgi:hypothetical protein
MSNKLKVFGLIIATALPVSSALSNERLIERGYIMQQDIRVHGKGRVMMFFKVCISGQVYLLVDGIYGENGVTTSFVDGKPEQCATKVQE